MYAGIAGWWQNVGALHAANKRQLRQRRQRVDPDTTWPLCLAENRKKSLFSSAGLERIRLAPVDGRTLKIRINDKYRARAGTILNYIGIIGTSNGRHGILHERLGHL